MQTGESMKRLATPCYITLLSAILPATSCSREVHVEPSRVSKIPGTEFVTGARSPFSISPDGEWLIFCNIVPDDYHPSDPPNSPTGIASIHLPTGQRTFHRADSSTTVSWDDLHEAFRPRGWIDGSFLIALSPDIGVMIDPTSPFFVFSERRPRRLACSSLAPLDVLGALIEERTGWPADDSQYSGSDLAWKDGRYGAYLYRNRGLQIVQIDSAGTQQVLVEERASKDGESIISGVAVSPDDRFVAYVFFRVARDLVKVFDRENRRTYVVGEYFRAGKPMWSPNGRQLYFFGELQPAPNQAIYRVALDSQ